MSVSTDDITVNNVGMLHKLVEVSGQQFPKEWFSEALHSDDLFKFAYFGEVPVASLKAKAVLPAHATDKTAPLGIVVEFFYVLPAYRAHGIEEKLLEHIETVAKERYLHDLWVLSPVEAKLEAFGYEQIEVPELQSYGRTPVWGKKL